MILRSVLAAGVLALQASAFLVPLEIANEVESAKAQLESLWSTQASTIELSCPGCTFPGPQQDGLEFSDNDENSIELNVLVEENTRLQINGETVFSLDSPVRPTALTAPQIRTSDSTPSRPIRLGYALELLPPRSFPNHAGQIITLQLTILDLEGVPVHVDTVKIDLYKNTGGLSLAKISSLPFVQSPGATECTTSLCRLRAIVLSRVRDMIEAAKARAKAAGAWAKAKGGCHGKKVGGGRHGQKAGGGPHHGHHAHHKMHRFGHILRQTLRFFIIPALLGVIGGLLASAVGMLVGQALVYLWFRFHRGGQRSGQRGNIRIIEVAVTDDEKDGLVEGRELPPQYEDVEAVVVEDTKE